MPGLDDEVAFISGVNADGTLALDSYASWNPDTIPADYSGGYTQAAKWGATTAGTAGGTIAYYFDPASSWTATEQQVFTADLALWSAVANISFVQTSSATAAQITFTRGSDGNAQTTPSVGNTATGGRTGGTELLQLKSAKVSIDTSKAGFGPIDGSFSNFGGYPFLTVLHEEAHAIGLEHAGPYNSTANEQTQQFSPYDTLTSSIMSYIGPWKAAAAYYSQYPVQASWGSTNGYHNVPTTWMPVDILAAQRLYGLPSSTPLSGGQVFGFNSNISGAIAPFFDFTKNTTPIVTLWDLGTGNTLDLSGFTASETVNLNPGSYSSVDGLTNNIAIAYNTKIDTLVCSSGWDTITCNNDGDTIIAGPAIAGQDLTYVYGGTGVDTFVLPGPSSSYTVTPRGTNFYSVNTSTSTNYLTDVEYVQFSDKTVSLVTDDYSADINTTGSIAIGGLANGTIEQNGDFDWFKVTLVAGRVYQFDLQGQSSGEGTLDDPFLSLRDSAGNIITSNDDYGSRDSHIVYTATTSGTYFLSASSAHGGGTYGTGTYRLSAIQVAIADDYSADTSTIGSVAVGGSSTGTLEANGDYDWFKVSLLAGHTYQFDLQGASTGHGTLDDPFLGLRDSAGNLITSNDDTVGRDSRITYTPATDGTFFLSASSAHGGGTYGTGTYRVVATDVSPDDYAGNVTTTGIVAVGGSSTGTIEVNGDTDWFKVTLVAGRTYQFDLQGQATGHGTLDDPFLVLRDQYGDSLAQNDDAVGRDSRISYTAFSSGTYFLQAGSAHGGGTVGTGTYRVVATQTDDYTADIFTTGLVAIGGSATGTIETNGDYDWFGVNSLFAGHTYQFDLQGAPSGNGTLDDPFLSLRDSSGNLIASNDDAVGRDSRITYTATSNGYVYLSASSAHGGGTIGTGTYRVVATDLTPDDYQASITTTGSVAVGGSSSGAIDFNGDYDWFKVNLVAGHTYEFDLSGASSGSGTLDDPFLSLRDSSGQLISSDDDSGPGRDSLITYTATSSGSYFLAASSAHGGGTFGTGTYHVAATDLTDDYAASTATTGTVAVGGSTTGNINYNGDFDWFKVTLTAGQSYKFDLKGLPSGNGTLDDPFLALRDGTGTLITSNDDYGSRDSHIAYTPTVSGTYFLSASSAHGGGTIGTGTYTLFAATGP